MQKRTNYARGRRRRLIKLGKRVLVRERVIRVLEVHSFILSYLALRLLHRLHTELDSWINWFRCPQLMQSAPPSPGIQELQLLLHKFWQKIQKIEKNSVF